MKIIEKKGKKYLQNSMNKTCYHKMKILNTVHCVIKPVQDFVLHYKNISAWKYSLSGACIPCTYRAPPKFTELEKKIGITILNK